MDIKTRALFPFGKLSQKEDLEEDDFRRLFDHPVFHSHARSIVMMLDAAISMLGPDMELFQRVFQNLGSRHVHYGVLPEVYPMVLEALTEAIGEMILCSDSTSSSGKNSEEKWTSLTRKCWSTAIQLILKEMTEGGNQSKSHSSSITPPPSIGYKKKKTRNLVKRPEEIGATCSKVGNPTEQEMSDQHSKAGVEGADIDSSHAVQRIDVENVKKTWKIITNIPNYTHVAGVLLFRK